MIIQIIFALFDLLNNCIYNPVLDVIGLTPDSALFDTIISTCI